MPKIKKIVSIVFAMSGFRLDHTNAFWIAGAMLTIIFGRIYVVSQNNWYLTINYLIVSLLFYYLGNTLILCSSLPKMLIARFGEDRAFNIYKTVVGLMFMNQALSINAIVSLSAGDYWPFSLSSELSIAIGAIMFMIGLGIKIWATMALGIDLYYYRDLFLGRQVNPFVCVGPYKYFANPMYGIGQIHAHGFALMYQSLIGLITTLTCHVLIYVFYFTVERPFIRRIYHQKVIHHFKIIAEESHQNSWQHYLHHDFHTIHKTK